jgi:ABC-type nitrate/sulfonate/bicarbonate transport system substrate-binding protein
VNKESRLAKAQQRLTVDNMEHCMTGSRHWTLLFSLIVFIGSVSATSITDAQDRVRISFSSVSDSYLYGAVAFNKGFFREEGLNAELIRMGGGVAVTALANGDTDYTLMFSQIIQAALSGLPLKVLASFTDNSTGLLVSKPGLKTIKEMQGKSVAISSFGAGAHVTADLMLRSAGMNPDDVKFVALGAELARFAALENGVVDAAILNPSTAFKAERLNFKIIARAYELFTFPYAGLGATEKKIREKPEEIKRVIKALLKGTRYIRENREGAIQVMMDWARVDRQTATDLYEPISNISSSDGSIPEKGLRLAIDHAKKRMKLDREFSVTEVADVSILKDVQRELKLKAK